MDQQEIIKQKKEKEKERASHMRLILLNAIKMQALHSGGKIKYIETSALVH